MALIKCVECGRTISDKATSCPNCGCPNQYQISASNPVTSDNSHTATWDSVYTAIDCGDLLGATKLIKTITGASIQEARETAKLIQNNRSSKMASKTNINAKSNGYVGPNRTVRCLECGKLYYSDMEVCPGCGLQRKTTTVEEYIDPSKMICKGCSRQISKKAESCPHCGNQTGVHVCPKCNGIDTETISGASKATSVLLFGVFAANNVISKFRCKSCGHKW